MGRFVSRPRTVRCVIEMTLAAGILTACAPGTAGSQVRQVTPAALEQAACEAEVFVLPTRSTTTGSAATAIGDNGWVAGWLTDSDGERAAVLWRDNGLPLDLGVRGVPVDINADGVIGINHVGNRRAAFLWRNGTVRKLSGTSSRPKVKVSALNGDGVAVGMIWGNEASRRAALWRNGQLWVLRPPSGAPVEKNYAGSDVNDEGLVIGWGYRSWWRTGGQTNRLSAPAGLSRWARSWATHVDARGRVLGVVMPQHEGRGLGPVIRWTSVHSKPRRYRSWGVIRALDSATGYLVGYNRRYGRSSVGHIGDMRGAPLPDPPTLVEESTGSPQPSSAFSQALDIATGRNPYAPNGGLTVVGRAIPADSDFGGGSHAVMWTCAQSYR